MTPARTAAYLVEVRDPIDPIALSKAQAGKAIGVSESTIDRYVRDGRLPVVRIDEGGRVLVDVDDLRAFVKAHRDPPLAEQES